jgi:hypothetical protein
MMRLITAVAVIGLISSTLGAAPLMADPGGGKGKGNKTHFKHGERSDLGVHRGYASSCPPGLAKKNPPCIPPGQARKHNVHYGNRVGDVLRVGDYIVVRDPARYDLRTRQGWDYYRDDNQIYRIDSSTRKVLAVMNLIDAFTE